MASDVEDLPDVEVRTIPEQVDMGEFLGAVKSVSEAAETVESLGETAAALTDSPLREEDVRDLMYGRNNELTKTDIEYGFNVLQDIASGRCDRPLVRLVSAYTDLNLNEAALVIEEMERLNDEYGHLRDDE